MCDLAPEEQEEYFRWRELASAPTTVRSSRSPASFPLKPNRDTAPAAA